MSEWNLILASQSPRRRELLSLLGLRFEVMTSDVREIPRADETPAELVTRLSRAKALAAELDGRHRALVIACDTIVALEEGPGEAEILGKPRHPDDGRAMLRRLRGRSHVVYSAATVWDSIRGVATDLVETQVRMRPYSEAKIRAYVASGDALDKAGAYAIQHQGFDPVDNIEGCYASVMGLPLCHVALRLRQRGLALPAEVQAVCQNHTGRTCYVYRQIWTPA